MHGMKKSFMLLFLSALIVFAMLMSGCGDKDSVSGENGSVTKGDISEMKVTSDSLSNGVWDEKITNTSYGRNVSPELTWSAVDGASEYAVYMVDPDGHNWLHWRVTGFKGTHLDEGEMPDGSEYVGPYPPSGTHRYIVTVYALKAKPDSIPGNFDSSNSSADSIGKALDISGGKSGNILAEGKLEGTYTSRRK